MASIWLRLLLLTIYLFLVLLVSRLLEVVLWYKNGVAPSQMINPLLLSVQQLKRLLESRGVSYTGVLEKQELTGLVEASGEVSHGEVSDIDSAKTVSPPPVSSHFTGGGHFYEEVEDTKDSVWLVQVIPAESHGVPLLDGVSWRTVVKRLAPLALRTGVFDCMLDRRLCIRKGWHQPQLILALPRGRRIKDHVIISNFYSSKPQVVIEWVQSQLATRIKTIQTEKELDANWMTYPVNNKTSVSMLRVIFFSSLLQPPLFLAALSIKFSGRVSFGMYKVTKKEEEKIKKKIQTNHIPSYVIVTPEKILVYGKTHGEHLNFRAMELYLRTLWPEMNDIFLCSLFILNGLVCMQVFLCQGKLWKHIIRCIWAVISYNFWLFVAWLVIYAICHFPFMEIVLEKCLEYTRAVSTSSLFGYGRVTWTIICKYPQYLVASFFLYGILVSWLWCTFHEDTEPEDEAVQSPWWDIFPMNSYVINFLFRPMASLTRPMAPVEFHLEEGLEFLIESMAVPTLWLQPIVPNDYIKELPTWHYQGWGADQVPLSGCEVYSDTELESPSETDADTDSSDACHNCQPTSDKSSEWSSLSEHPEILPCTYCEVCHHLQTRRKLSVSVQKGKANNTAYVTSPCIDRRNKRCHCHKNRNARYCQCILRRNSSSHSFLVCNPDRIDSDTETKDKFRTANNQVRKCGHKQGCGHSVLNRDVSVPESYNVYPENMLQTYSCAICLERYQWGVELCGLPCGHNYHHSCITMWLEKDNHNCPICRWPTYMSKAKVHHHME